jgi:hypothetical protein
MKIKAALIIQNQWGECPRLADDRGCAQLKMRSMALAGSDP